MAQSHETSAIDFGLLAQETKKEMETMHVQTKQVYNYINEKVKR